MAAPDRAERLATGHYARIAQDAVPAAVNCVARPRRTTRPILFPLSGGLSEERSLERLLPSASSPRKEVRATGPPRESARCRKAGKLELCFVPNGNYFQFIHAYSQSAESPYRTEKVKSKRERELDRTSPRRFMNFTIGQREGLGPVRRVTIDLASFTVGQAPPGLSIARSCRLRRSLAMPTARQKAGDDDGCCSDELGGATVGCLDMFQGIGRFRSSHTWEGVDGLRRPAGLRRSRALQRLTWSEARTRLRRVARAAAIPRDRAGAFGPVSYPPSGAMPMIIGTASRISISTGSEGGCCRLSSAAASAPRQAARRSSRS